MRVYPNTGSLASTLLTVRRQQWYYSKYPTLEYAQVLWNTSKLTGTPVQIYLREVLTWQESTVIDSQGVSHDDVATVLTFGATIALTMPTPVNGLNVVDWNYTSAHKDKWFQVGYSDGGATSWLYKFIRVDEVLDFTQMEALTSSTFSEAAVGISGLVTWAAFPRLYWDNLNLQQSWNDFLDGVELSDQSIASLVIPGANIGLNPIETPVEITLPTSIMIPLFGAGLMLDFWDVVLAIWLHKKVGITIAGIPISVIAYFGLKGTEAEYASFLPIGSPPYKFGDTTLIAKDVIFSAFVVDMLLLSIRHFGSGAFAMMKAFFGWIWTRRGTNLRDLRLLLSRSERVSELTDKIDVLHDFSYDSVKDESFHSEIEGILTILEGNINLRLFAQALSRYL